MAEVIKRDVKKATGTAEKTVKKAAPKAEKAVKETVKEEKVPEKKEKEVKPAKTNRNAGGLRIGAALLWLCAFACEVVAILVLKEKIELPFTWTPLTKMLIFLALDLVFVIIGSQLWKKANHKDPVSEKNKLKFWLWNNMGVIVCAFAFIPFIVLTLSDKKADPKTKKIAAIAAAVALVIGGLTSYDYNPMSEEKAANAENILDGETVYWTSGGARYHLDQDCSSLSNSAEIYAGTVDEAIHDYGKDYLCKFCMKKHQEDMAGIENLVYGANVEVETEAADE